MTSVRICGPIVVTAAVIERDGKILIAQRKPDSTFEALKWEFPGGKLEAGETPEACLVREIKEELDLEIAVKDFVGLSSHVYRADPGEALHIVLLCYRCALVKGEERAVDVHALKWISPQELVSYDFAAADVPLVKCLANP
ncbi:MAG: (deoxy)nucleoside triphosphate pyrophosphohydrolase [Bdellovibrionaceae bacterium]|nr:(deoxy)nucleoside triphosphate pyrophosphohydrolase [Pseudobdellovibrionaceae bacterium]